MDKIIVCIKEDIGNKYPVIVGEQYTIQEEINGYYLLFIDFDNRSIMKWYPTKLFKLLSEVREEKLNNLLN